MGSLPRRQQHLNLDNLASPQVLATIRALVNRATGVANTPYTAYPGEQVAPLSNQTILGSRTSISTATPRSLTWRGWEHGARRPVRDNLQQGAVQARLHLASAACRAGTINIRSPGAHVNTMGTAQAMTIRPRAHAR